MSEVDEIRDQVDRLPPQVLEGTILLTEELAGDDLGDRLAKANAKMSRKIFDALVGERFTRQEAVQITAATMGKK